MLPKTRTKPKHTLSDLTALVYGPSKIGKRHLVLQSRGCLVPGDRAGAERPLEVFQTSRLPAWDDLLQACAEIAEGKHEFKNHRPRYGG